MDVHGFSLLNNLIFHSYVKLPEGIIPYDGRMDCRNIIEHHDPRSAKKMVLENESQQKYPISKWHSLVASYPICSMVLEHIYQHLPHIYGPVT